jgi:leader peptidase (prepilin peptidase)/N-methyltransferase
MDYMPMALAAAAGVAFGWWFPTVQHVLYRNEEYRENPASGRRRLWLQVFCMLAAGGIGAAALRPDHYDIGPGVLTFAFGLVFVGVSSTDFERRIIPNKLTYPAILAAALLGWAWPDRSWLDVVGGAGVAIGLAVAMVVFGFVAGFVLGVKETPFGMGDAKLILLAGLVVGWPAILPALFIGVVLGGVAAVVLLFRGGRRSVYSYGPYLAAGAVVVMLWFGRFVD